MTLEGAERIKNKNKKCFFPGALCERRHAPPITWHTTPSIWRSGVSLSCRNKDVAEGHEDKSHTTSDQDGNENTMMWSQEMVGVASDQTQDQRKRILHVIQYKNQIFINIIGIFYYISYKNMLSPV